MTVGLLSLLSLDLRRLATLRLSVPALLSAIQLRHSPLKLARLLPVDLSVLSLRMSVLPLRLPVPLRHLSLELRLLSLDLRSLCLTIHLRKRSLHLRYLPLHLRTLALLSLALRPLLSLHLRLLSLHLWAFLTLRSLPHLPLLTATASISAASVTAIFLLRGNPAETTHGKHQQERKKCK